MTQDKQFWVVIPAAGKGSRMASATPKQFLLIQQRPVLDYTLEVFLQNPQIAGIVVVCNGPLPMDTAQNVHTCEGGAERWHSVLNGLHYLKNKIGVAEEDWVLVHDAARPCLSQEDLNKLLQAVTQARQGGLLGVPLADTLKRVTGDRVCATVDRSQLWRAMTPQMFPLQALIEAIEQSRDNHLEITDEASAMEAMGQQPLMVHGRADNIKITLPEDLDLARLYLRRMGRC